HRLEHGRRPRGDARASGGRGPRRAPPAARLRRRRGRGPGPPARAACARGGVPAADRRGTGGPRPPVLTPFRVRAETRSCQHITGPRGGQGRTAMDEWLEEDLSLLTGGGQAPRVLDQRMIREPIRYLAPRPPVCVAPTDTVIDTIR